MKSKRTSFALLFATFGALALFANCTVKESDESCSPGTTHKCTCSNGDTGSQVCNDEGTKYGSCSCDGSDGNGGSSNTTNNNEGGAGNDTSTAGKGGTTYAGSSQGGSAQGGTTSEAGAAAVEGGAGGAGADPFANIDPTDCGACLAQLCPQQWQDCVDDPLCLSAGIDGSGQYELIQNGCIEPEREKGVVKRDAVRGCGVSIGKGTDPQFTVDWAPQQMQPSTTALMNCMAMGAKMPDASWANDEANFPIVDGTVQPVPWPEGTCAKLACTGKVDMQ